MQGSNKPQGAQVIRRAAFALQEFFRMESAGGILLIVAAVIALLLANSPALPAYREALQFPIAVRAGSLLIDKPLLLWINDGLMAVFFLLVALEIKREALSGQLAAPGQLAMPLLAALGGVVAPALIYVAVNRGDGEALQGWAIPAATDIAFALGILGLLGSRVPLALKLLLSTIAVIDDLAAIVIIAVFYTADLSANALALAGALCVLMVVMNRLGVRSVAPYLAVGALMWICVLKSGVHATLAGVVTGLCIPHRGGSDEESSPLESLEHDLHPLVAFAILPVFAFANAGVPLGDTGVSALVHPVPLGIALGLLVGKPLGVFGSVWLGGTLGLLRRPPELTLSRLFGVAMLCGIGFTMSLFIGSLAFEHGARHYAELNRIGILAGSVLSAVLGLFWLRHVLPPDGDPR